MLYNRELKILSNFPGSIRPLAKIPCGFPKALSNVFSKSEDKSSISIKVETHKEHWYNSNNCEAFMLPRLWSLEEILWL